jgi:hypothetical protein
MHAPGMRSSRPEQLSLFTVPTPPRREPRSSRARRAAQLALNASCGEALLAELQRVGRVAEEQARAAEARRALQLAQMFDACEAAGAERRGVA